MTTATKPFISTQAELAQKFHDLQYQPSLPPHSNGLVLHQKGEDYYLTTDELFALLRCGETHPVKLIDYGEVRDGDMYFTFPDPELDTKIEPTQALLDQTLAAIEESHLADVQSLTDTFLDVFGGIQCYGCQHMVTDHYADKCGLLNCQCAGAKLYSNTFESPSAARAAALPVEPLVPTKAEVNKATKALHGFISADQLRVLRHNLKGEESEFFARMLVDLAERIRTMPHTYQQEKLGDNAIAYLHYFNGSMDFYITEKDRGARDDSPEEFQSQAFGLVVSYETERGYISIRELIQNGVELDLYWKPQTIATILKKQDKD